MSDTISFYNNNTKSFIESTLNADMDDCRDKFLAYMPKGGRILDFGCGSGRAHPFYILREMN